ncbi:MAG: flavodoxin family protein [Steroidobacteraceae bacterium]|nr:flavodoxin family protein [Steroidobacteraceae bacterium]
MICRPRTVRAAPPNDAGVDGVRSILIVYHSQTGGTRQMVEAARQGAAEAEPALEVRLRHADSAGSGDLLAADGYLFATPENLAAISGVVKHFFDRTYYAVLERIVGRPYAAMVCAGSDGSNAARQIERIATGWRLEPIAPPLIVCTRAQTPEQILGAKQIGEADRQRCRELGATLASGIALGIF